MSRALFEITQIYLNVVDIIIKRGKVEEKRAKFMRVFAKVPEKIRNEDIIVVVDDKPFTWNNAMIEVKNDSKLGKKIIKVLEKLKII